MWFKYRFSTLTQGVSKKFYISSLEVTTTFIHSLILKGSNWLKNLLTIFMARCGLFPHYFMTNQSDKWSGVDSSVDFAFCSCLMEPLLCFQKGCWCKWRRPSVGWKNTTYQTDGGNFRSGQINILAHSLKEWISCQVQQHQKAWKTTADNLSG